MRKYYSFCFVAITRCCSNFSFFSLKNKIKNRSKTIKNQTKTVSSNFVVNPKATVFKVSLRCTGCLLVLLLTDFFSELLAKLWFEAFLKPLLSCDSPLPSDGFLSIDLLFFWALKFFKGFGKVFGGRWFCISTLKIF